MSDPVRSISAQYELCYSNCPRIHPSPVGPRHEESADEQLSATSPRQLPIEFQSAIGRRLFPDRAKPCYLLIRHTRPHCRALRNFIIGNSTKLQVVKADYCGIATKVFNLHSNALEPLLSIGLLRFSSTTHAFQFVTNEHKMSRNDFLGGRFDIWNLTLRTPSGAGAGLAQRLPAQPIKNPAVSPNVFHFVHIRSLALLPDGVEMSPEARQAATAASAELQERLESSLETVEGYAGRLVVKATSVARIRGLPYHNPSGEPRISVYMTQWAGVRQFWDWQESPSGSDYNKLLLELTGGSHDSLLFTVCLDFVDLM